MSTRQTSRNCCICKIPVIMMIKSSYSKRNRAFIIGISQIQWADLLQISEFDMKTLWIIFGLFLDLESCGADHHGHRLLCHTKLQHPRQSDCSLRIPQGKTGTLCKPHGFRMEGEFHNLQKTFTSLERPIAERPSF